MILNIDTEIIHKLLIMIPRDMYHKNKKGFKELRTRYQFTDWHGCSWTDGYGNKIETHFQKRYEATDRFSTFDGDILIITGRDMEFIEATLHFWNVRGASILDMTDKPKIEVLVNGEFVKHEVIE